MICFLENVVSKTTLSQHTLGQFAWKKLCDIVFKLNQYIGHYLHLDLRTNEGWTPVMFSIKNGNYEMTKLLIDLGCDINMIDNSGLNALSHACQAGNKEIIELLISKGAEFSTDKTGMTPQAWASRLSYDSSVNHILLRTFGKDVLKIVKRKVKDFKKIPSVIEFRASQISSKST